MSKALSEGISGRSKYKCLELTAQVAEVGYLGRAKETMASVKHLNIN